MKKETPNRILDYLLKNGGVDYRSPKKQSDPKEAERYQELYNTAKNVIDEFGELVYELGSATGMVSFYHNEVLDGSRRRLRGYYWGELRTEQYYQDHESISVFAEKNESVTRYRVSLEIDELHAGVSSLNRHNRLLDLPIAKNCILAVNNKGAKDLVLTESREEAIQWIKNGDYRKVQICCLIEPNSVTDMFQRLLTAVQTIRPYYDYVVKK